MIGFMILAALLSQDLGPKSLNTDSGEVPHPIVVPAGTVIPVTLISCVNSKNVRDGDGVYGKTAFPITIDNMIVIPEGSHVRGNVIAVKRPGRVTGKAELTLSFQTLILPDGTTIPIYASLGGAGGSGKRKGEATVEGDSNKTQDAQTIGAAATDGALIGVIADHGKGAAIGGASGGAVGTAAVLLTRGEDLVLGPGTTIEIVLDRPIEP